MASRAPRARVFSKRVRELKMAANNTDMNSYQKWGTLDERVFSRTSDLMMEAASADEFVPNTQRRSIMDLALLGGAALLVGGHVKFFFAPPLPV